MRKFMNGLIPAIPRINFGIVDVRDVAEAHLQAILKPEANGKRFLLVGGNAWMEDVCRWLREKWGQQLPIPSRNAPKFVMQIIGLWDKEANGVLKDWNIKKTFDTTST
jgi:nucleoside-diphosphate-sugar epimerase